MKKLSLFLFATLIFASCDKTTPTEDTTYVKPEASTTISTDFNNWYKQTPNKYEDYEEYLEVNSTLYKTLNSLSTLPKDFGTSCPLTALQDKGASGAEGDYSIKLVSAMTPPVTSELIEIFLPGAVGTLRVLFDKETAHFGVPHTENENKISFKYKYTPVENDSASVLVQMWKWNGVKRDTIASAEKKMYGNQTSWENVELDIDYKVGFADVKPDSINVVIAASAGYNFIDLFTCEGQIGSTLWIDDLVISKK